MTLPVTPAPAPSKKARFYEVTRQPLLWAAFAFSAGIAAGTFLWRPPLWWLLAGGAFLATALYFARRRAWLSRGLVLVAVFSCGALIVQPGYVPDEDSVNLRDFADDTEMLVTAHVTREGELKPEGFGELRQTLDVQTEQIYADDQNYIERGGVRVSLYTKQSKNEAAAQASPQPRVFHYGERLRFPAKLNLPRNFRNPGAFDYRGYLVDQGILALASTKTDQVEMLPGFSGSKLELWRTRARRRIVDTIQSLWPPEQAGVISAMLLGEESFLGRPLRTDFQRTGTYLWFAADWDRFNAD